jgi:hypothetical protein
MQRSQPCQDCDSYTLHRIETVNGVEYARCLNSSNHEFALNDRPETNLVVIREFRWISPIGFNPFATA